jgi:multidrug efflux pump subunit AcrB
MLDDSLVSQAIYAQNLEVPAGSLTEGIASYLVKVGDRIITQDSLETLPVMTIDFKEIFTGYAEIINALKNVHIYASWFDRLENMEDEDGFYQSMLKALDEALIDLYNDEGGNDFSLLVPSQWETIVVIDPSTGNSMTITIPKTYKVTGDITDFLRDIASLAPEEDTKVDLTNLATIAALTTFAQAFGMNFNELITYLDRLSIIVVEYDENRVPLSISFSDSLSGLLDQFGELASDLEEIEISAENIREVHAIINDLRELGTEIANLSKEASTYLSTHPEMFTPVFSEGTQEISYYEFNVAWLEVIEKLPQLKMTLGGFSDIYHLDTSSKILNLVNGSAGVMIAINKQPDYSTVDVSNAVKAYLEAEKEKNPSFDYLLLSDQGESVMMMIKSIVQNIVIGMGLAVIILFLFLRDTKATIIVSLSMVISIVTAFVFMYMSGISLNILSLSGLCLGVGMLVDNSIVVLENIYKLRGEGKSIYRACVQGAKEMGGAITASTITTIIVFVPLIFLKGITQQLIMDIALTLTFSLLASLIVALTLVPMASSYLLKPSKAQERLKQSAEAKENLDKNGTTEIKTVENESTEKKTFLQKLKAIWRKINSGGENVLWFERMRNFYAKMLEKTLKNKWITLIVVFVLFLGSIGGLFGMRRIFFPATDAGAFTMTVAIDRNKLSNESSYEENVKDAINLIYNTAMSNTDDVGSVGIELSSGMSLMGVSIGASGITTYVTLNDDTRKSSETVAKELKAECLKVLGTLDSDAFDITYNADSGALGSVSALMSADSLTVVFTGSDLDLMRDQAQILAKRISDANIKGVIEVDNGSTDATEEYHIVIDKEKAAAAGMTVGQIYQLLNAEFAEPTEATSLNYKDEGKIYNVFVYRDVFEVKRWVELLDNGIETKVFVERNVKTGVDSYYFLDDDGEKVAVTYDKERDRFTYGERNYELSKPNSGALLLYYDTVRKDDLDLINFEINATLLAGTQLEYTVNKKLWQLCADESFARNDDGEIAYRRLKDENGNPKFDADGNPQYETITDENNVVINVPKAIAKEPGYRSITHNDGVTELLVTTKVDIEKYNIANVSTQIEKILKDFQDELPEGVGASFRGEEPMIIDVYQTLIIVLGVGIILIYLVMVAQFQSFKLPFIIMFTIPLAFTGSVVALLITGTPISVVALVGLIILMGVVVNNGIVFIDNVKRLIDSGYNKHDALITTARDRLRPILMTALTTIIALFGMALDGSAAGSMMQPMGITTLGGLLYATFLTLFIVPIMFDILDKGKKSRFSEEDKDDEFAHEDLAIEHASVVSSVDSMTEIKISDDTLKIIDTEINSCDIISKETIILNNATQEAVEADTNSISTESVELKDTCTQDINLVESVEKSQNEISLKNEDVSKAEISTSTTKDSIDDQKN